jgi:uncharacterized protein
MAKFGALTAMICLFTLSGNDDYGRDVEDWRQKREANLKADDGWLTVVGLSWLNPGDTRIGSDPDNDVVLPSGAPAVVGTLRLDGDAAEFRADPNVEVLRDRKAFGGGALRSDAKGKPDVLAVGDIRLILLKRGTRYALRIKDNRSPQRTAFSGLEWYPISEDWRISAKFVAHASDNKIVMDTIVGEPMSLECPGYVVFERAGKEYRLEAAVEDDKLWFVFRDGTSGRTTHPGARQLIADPPKDGVVILDFNKAINFPCAFTPYATCPLAPPANRLKLAIEAGEMKYRSRPVSPAKTP